MNGKNASDIIAKYKAGTCTEEELALVQDWILYGEFDELKYSEAEIKEDLKELDSRLPIHNPNKVKLWPRIAAVAAAVAMVVFGVWFFNYRSTTETSSVQVPSLVMKDIAPGKNGATITLGNGKVIELSDAKSGVVIGQDLKYNDGEILRDALDDKGAEDLTASTTKGQTYIFTLPDGTKVWLNAASSLTIPSDFSGTETRKVELTGEAYFEVAKNKKRPFIVASNGQEVTVLGTHFNISAYEGEGSIKTTLLEGSVKVTGRDPSELGMTSGRGTALSSRANAKDLNAVVLKPNQQSVITGSDRISVKEVNTADAVAWKEGAFVFHSERIADIMRQVQRWYDIEVIFESNSIAQKKFTADISRYDNISKLLNILQKTGQVKFKIEGKKVYVGE